MSGTVIDQFIPFLPVAVALAGAGLVVATRRRPNLREGCSLAAAVLQFLLVVGMIPPILDGQTLHFTVLSFLPQVAIAFRVDALGLLFAITASFLWILTTVYSIGYMRHLREHAQTRYYAFFALAMAATVGIAFSANLVTLYIFYELLTFITYPLLTHSGSPAAYAAGKKYLMYQLGASFLFLLPAIIVTYTLSGTFDFQPNGVLPAAANATVLVLVYGLFLAGAAKAAIMPFHSWLPAAMVAPTPVSALLHAVAVVNAGVFLILRVILDIFGQDLLRQLRLDVVTIVVVSVTILVASFHALRLDSLKAVLAYSTISQLSYMILGVVLLGPTAMIGGVIHLVNHAVAKITLFFCAGSIDLATGRTKISELSGIGRQMPWTMAAFSIAALSIVGIPPTAGFITKWFLAAGSIEADKLAVFFVLLTGTLLSAAYYLRIIRTAFFGSPAREGGEEATHQAAGGSPQEPERIREVSPLILAPLLVSAALSVILGIYPGFFIDLVQLALP